MDIEVQEIDKRVETSESRLHPGPAREPKLEQGSTNPNELSINGNNRTPGQVGQLLVPSDGSASATTEISLQLLHTGPVDGGKVNRESQPYFCKPCGVLLKRMRRIIFSTRVYRSTEKQLAQ